jgi:pimeloyl-ACP methyl ester carboxylesterase
LRSAPERGREEEPAPRHAVSEDGTQIAYWESGEGPPLVLVHGGTADHARWRPLLPYLEPRAEVHALDRRGRGASGDGPEYHLAREYEDVAAVVAAVADETGAAVDVYGHSYGGLVAFGAAALTTGGIRRLVLYEGWPTLHPEAHALPPGVGERIDDLLAGGRREEALEVVMRDVVLVHEDELRAIRAQPSWPARVAAVHTIRREIRALEEAILDPAQAAKVTAPTLLLTGSESPDPATRDLDAVAAALPDARVGVLEGQGHLADVLAPELFAEHLLGFLRGERV